MKKWLASVFIKRSEEQLKNEPKYIRPRKVGVEGLGDSK
jgi:hypothetical protein